MTKKEAEALKKVINADRHYTTYFVNKTGALRVRVYSYDGVANGENYSPAKERAEIAKLLNKVSNFGIRPKFEIDHKTYQGFIHDTNVVFQ